MTDIGSGIVGSFNQAHQASRRVESENARTRGNEQLQAREARERFIAAQEEVEAAQTLRQRRIESDKENSSGRDARDQYEAHDQFGDESPQPQEPSLPPSAAEEVAADNPDDRPESGDSGHLIDVKA
ncbi:MAG: hypothetical protein JXL80_01300 [Planctomycetes bacterium]|nr:hypothetical protein [Planctomycetota bacterium]